MMGRREMGILLTFVMLSTFAVHAQKSDTLDTGQQILNYYDRIPQERIYLQTDKPYYAAGDTVWLRAHLLDAETGVPVSRSHFVYVELHDQQADTLMQRLMIRSDADGVFANALRLPKDLPGGVYTLVAYTQWMRNFGVARFCYQPLTIVGGQRVRGHRIPESLLPRNDAQVSISGRAATARAPMTLDIDVRDRNGHPLPGTYALSVTDYDVVRPDSLFWDIRQSLLRQPAGQPTDDTIGSIVYPYQEQQLITGRVKGTLGQRIRNPHLLVVNSQTGQRWEFELGDSSRFALAVDNPNGTVFTMEGTRRRGQTALVELQIDPQTFPKVALPHYHLTPSTTDLSAFVTQSQTQQMYSQAGYIELPEIEKVGRKPKVQRENVMGIEALRGIPAGDPRLEHAPTVAAQLAMLGLYATWVDGVGVIPFTKVYVDNIEEEDHDYVLSLPATDIKSIELFPKENAINSMFGVRPTGNGHIPGVLFIFLKDGSDIVHSKAARPLSMVTVRQQGYEPSADFYSPQYDTPTADNRPDHRTTLYWNPKVKSGSTVCFYASDVSKRYLVTLEGVSSDGTVIHHQQVIE